MTKTRRIEVLKQLKEGFEVENGKIFVEIGKNSEWITFKTDKVGKNHLEFYCEQVYGLFFYYKGE